MRRRLYLLILAAGAILVSGFLLSKRVGSAPPQGTGPAGPAVSRSGFASAWTSRPVLLVGLGDSVTEGFGARRGYGYFERLISNPPDEYPEMKGLSLSTLLPHLAATNLSVSGSISIELAESQLPRLPHVDTNTIGLIVITTGGNDLIHNYGRTPPREQAMYGASLNQAKPWIEHFEKRLDRIVECLTTNFPGGCHIFLANIYDPTDAAGDIQSAGLPAWPEGMSLLASYNDVIKQCAARHPQVHLVNLHDMFLGHGIHCAQRSSKHYDSKDPHYWYYENLEDPNERGYDAIRRLFLIEIGKVAGSLR